MLGLSEFTREIFQSLLGFSYLAELVLPNSGIFVLRFSRNNLVLGICQEIKHAENFLIRHISYMHISCYSSTHHEQFQKNWLRVRDALRDLLNIYDKVFCEMFLKDLNMSLRVMNFWFLIFIGSWKWYSPWKTAH